MYYNNKVTKAFLDGIKKRQKTPLTFGRYKFIETIRGLRRLQFSLKSISEFQCNNLPSLNNPCYPSEVPDWLKKLPLEIADYFGHNVLPSIAALKKDGLPEDEIEYFQGRFVPQIEEYIDECAVVFNSSKMFDNFGTPQWRTGCLLLNALLEKGTGMIKEIVDEAEKQLKLYSAQEVD